MAVPAGGPFGAGAGLELHVVHGRTNRHVAQRRVTRTNLCALARHQLVADLKVTGSEDVALLAVVVVQGAMLQVRFGSYSIGRPWRGRRPWCA